MLQSQQAQVLGKKNMPHHPRSTLTGLPYSPLSFNKRRPKFIQPGSHLNPVLQNMFDIGYFQGPVGTFPTGWNDVDEDKVYTSITSRIPHVQQDEDVESGNEIEEHGNRSESDSSNEDEEQVPHVTSGMTRMAEESSDEDPIPPPRRVSAISFARAPSHSSFAMRGMI